MHQFWYDLQKLCENMRIRACRFYLWSNGHIKKGLGKTCIMLLFTNMDLKVINIRLQLLSMRSFTLVYRWFKFKVFFGKMFWMIIIFILKLADTGSNILYFSLTTVFYLLDNLAVLNNGLIDSEYNEIRGRLFFKIHVKKKIQQCVGVS